MSNLLKLNSINININIFFCKKFRYVFSFLIISFIEETRFLGINIEDELDEIELPAFDSSTSVRISWLIWRTRISYYYLIVTIITLTYLLFGIYYCRLSCVRTSAIISFRSLTAKFASLAKLGLRWFLVGELQTANLYPLLPSMIIKCVNLS